MKRFFSILVIMMVAFVISACNASTNEVGGAKNYKSLAIKGHKAVKTIKNLPYFDRIVVQGAFDVVFTQTHKNCSAMVEGRKSVVENVKLSVKNETLYISLSDKDWLRINRSEHADIHLYSPDLVAVEKRGAGDFDVKGALDTDTLKVELKGAGDLDFDRVVCDVAYFLISGAGDLEVDKLTAKYTKVDVRGAGSAELEFSNAGHVDCSIKGAGDLELKGTISSLKQSVKGAGSIDTKKLVVRNHIKVK